MGMMDIFLFGSIAGIIAAIVDPNRSKGGIVGAVVVGVAGAFVGAMVANTLLSMGILGFNKITVFLVILGSALLLFIGRDFSRLK